MTSPVKAARDHIPFVLMAGAAVGLTILSLYSMAAVSVVEHLKGRVRVKGRNLLRGAWKGNSGGDTYAHERAN